MVRPTILGSRQRMANYLWGWRGSRPCQGPSCPSGRRRPPVFGHSRGLSSRARMRPVAYESRRRGCSDTHNAPPPRECHLATRLLLRRRGQERTGSPTRPPHSGGVSAFHRSCSVISSFGDRLKLVALRSSTRVIFLASG